MTEHIPGPRPPQDREDLVHRLAAGSHVGTERLEFGGAPPETESQRETTTGEQVDRRRVLGQPKRIVQRCQQDTGGDLDT